jgi:hypothetical protein
MGSCIEGGNKEAAFLPGQYKKALTMTMSPLWFWEEEQQQLVLFWHGMRYGINIAFFRDGGWCRHTPAYAEIAGK